MAYLQDQIRDINAFHLDKKVIWIWALNSTVPSLVLIIFITAVSFAFGGSVLGIASYDLPLWSFLFLLLLNIMYIAWLHLEYKYYIYYFTTSSIVIKKGVLTTERHVVPYESVQDIRISRSIVERLLNLASIKIETAAHGSYITKYLIPSVSNYKSIVNHVMEKTRMLAGKAQKQKISDNQKIISLLEALVREVKDLKNVLSKKETITQEVKDYEKSNKV